MIFQLLCSCVVKDTSSGIRFLILRRKRQLPDPFGTPPQSASDRQPKIEAREESQGFAGKNTTPENMMYQKNWSGDFLPANPQGQTE